MVANVVWLHTFLKLFLRFLSNLRNAKCHANTESGHRTPHANIACEHLLRMSATEGRHGVPALADLQWRTRQRTPSKPRIVKMISTRMAGRRSLQTSTFDSMKDQTHAKIRVEVWQVARKQTYLFRTEVQVVRQSVGFKTKKVRVGCKELVYN